MGFGAECVCLVLRWRGEVSKADGCIGEIEMGVVVVFADGLVCMKVRFSGILCCLKWRSVLAGDDRVSDGRCLGIRVQIAVLLEG